MIRADHETVLKLRKKYPEGTRVRLIQMNDKWRDMRPGMLGTVYCVDDTGTIHVTWDAGFNLGVLYKIDKCEIIGGEK